MGRYRLAVARHRRCRGHPAAEGMDTNPMHAKPPVPVQDRMDASDRCPKPPPAAAGTMREAPAVRN